MSESERPSWSAMTEEAVIGGQRPIVYSHCRLRVTAGPSVGRALESEKDTIRVGTAPDNDLVLEDSLVSRFHLEVRKVQGSFRLVDVGSKNGTFVGEVEIREALIRKRTELSLGESTVVLEPLSTEVVPPIMLAMLRVNARPSPVPS